VPPPPTPVFLSVESLVFAVVTLLLGAPRTVPPAAATDPTVPLLVGCGVVLVAAAGVGCFVAAAAAGAGALAPLTVLKSQLGSD